MDHSDLPPILHYCSSCEARVVFTPIYVYEREAPDGRVEEYTLTRCSICGEPALFYRDEVEFQESVLQIPEAQFHRLWENLPRGLSFPVPPAIDIPYSEACEAELLHLPMSAAVMIGRALEAILEIVYHIRPKFQAYTRRYGDG